MMVVRALCRIAEPDSGPYFAKKPSFARPTSVLARLSCSLPIDARNFSDESQAKLVCF